MNRKAAFELSVSFIVILIICIVIFGFSIYMLKKFFSHAETVKMIYDERTEQEIERLLDDGSRIAIPFDKKTIGNGEFKTFGIGILNTLNVGPSNEFSVTIRFSKAFKRDNTVICAVPPPSGTPPYPPVSDCGSPDTWLKTTSGAVSTIPGGGVTLEKTVNNNEQEKFLLGVSPKSAPKGTYVFDLNTTYQNNTNINPSLWNWVQYDSIHKLYVDVS